VRRLSRLTPVVLIALGLAAAPLATGATSGSSTSKTTSVEISHDVDLNLIGKSAAFVTVKYTCLPATGGGYVPLSTVTLTDSVGNSDTSFFPQTCDGTKHSGVALMGGVFVPGDGVATALVCGLDCNFDSEAVKIGPH
jgi:hypothetical protein